MRARSPTSPRATPRTARASEVTSDEASLTIAAVSTEPAALTLEMQADPTTFSAVDEIISYTYLLTNTGGVALDAVSVIDTELGDVACPSVALEPGGSVLCMGSYSITQDDLDAGSVTNSAQAHGTYGEGAEVASDEVSLTITAVATEPAALTLEMRADVTTFSAVDEVIEYDYLLTNTGGVVLDVLISTPCWGTWPARRGPWSPTGPSSARAPTTSPRPTSMRARSSTSPRARHVRRSGAEVASDEASLTITAVSTP